VTNKLTWLHISDIHFQPKTEWRDNAARNALLEYLKDIYNDNAALRPDLIFCTGDIAFGEIRSAPIAEQYKQAEEFFDSLLVICGKNEIPLLKERLFVVPGNHDVNRSNINSDAQLTLTNWAKQPTEHVAEMNRRFNEQPNEFKAIIQRLDEYAQFIDRYLPHQHDEGGRHCYARMISVNGLKVGIAGFNSSWTCAGPEDDRTLWLAAEWQFNTAKTEIKEADVIIGLIHHPIDWLNAAEQDIAKHRIAANFQFWLHGHTHNTWVEPTQTHITIAAGAVGAETSGEFGINLVCFNQAESKGVVHLHTYSPRDDDWTILPVAKHARNGQWSFNLPAKLPKDAPPVSVSPPEPLPSKRNLELFGIEALIKDATSKLLGQPFLFVYGLRGNGKSSLIEELGKVKPLTGKEHLRFPVTPSTTASELFQQIATLLGEMAEFPHISSSDPKAVEAELRQRYPKPRPAWIWIDRAHHLLESGGQLRVDIHNLLLGLKNTLGMQWHWVFELRERPAKGVLSGSAYECEVLGLDKFSLAECLAHGSPAGREADWRFSGNQLKSIYQWLGGGQGAKAHPLAIQLLIEVARGRNETPFDVLMRHRVLFEQQIEEKLLGDLYDNVLNDYQQQMIQALALYRSAIPHDHADVLERRLNILGAWDGLDRRCLLAPNADHSFYYLHSFIAGWLRTRMGYAGHGEDDEADFLEVTDSVMQQKARKLHSVIATCWLEQLGGSGRVTNQNISRALEAFHHLVAAGEVDRIQSIAIKLLSGNLEWACNRIEYLYNYLYKSRAPIGKLRGALEYAAFLNPDDHKVQRFLGECWVKEEGQKSSKALKCFEEACRLRRDFPPYWANLGKILLAHGEYGAITFLKKLEALEIDCPQAINDHVRSIQSDCLMMIGQVEKASELRLTKIQAGSRHPAFYVDEAKARMDAGDAKRALEILDLAERNGCANDFTASIRASVLQQSGQSSEASELRLTKIQAGSRDPVFYVDEAKARMNAGDAKGALEILDLAERNGCTDDFTASIRASVLRKQKKE
jgi:predicted MPP superfamily phosphohydrolase